MSFKYEDYGDWAKSLAYSHTTEQLKSMLLKEEFQQQKAIQSHLNAIKKTSSMSSNSQRRAQSRNVVNGSYEKIMSLRHAIEIKENIG
jgi:hypothetical protein